MIDVELLEDRMRHPVVRDLPRLGIDTVLDDAARPLRPLFLRASERLAHEADPHRQRRGGTLLVRAERPELIEPDPRRADDVRVEADEPEIAAVVRGARLAGEVVALELSSGTVTRAAPHVVPHEVADQVRVLRRDN